MFLKTVQKTIIHSKTSDMEFNGNTSQWIGKMSKMRYKRNPKQTFDRIPYAMVTVITGHKIYLVMYLIYQFALRDVYN
jgi:hypothetical protein